jgi:hypothetical protein
MWTNPVPGAPPCAPEGKIANHRCETELVVGTAADTHVLGFVDKSDPPERGPLRVLQDRFGRDLPRGPEGHVVIYADPPLDMRRRDCAFEPDPPLGTELRDRAFELCLNPALGSVCRTGAPLGEGYSAAGRGTR